MMLHSGPGRITVSSEKFSLTSVISISHPVKFLLASSIIQSILLCIASNILAIRIRTKNAHTGIICPFFFLLSVDRNILSECSSPDVKTSPFCELIPSVEKSPPAQASCVAPWCAGCCIAIAVVNYILL